MPRLVAEQQEPTVKLFAELLNQLPYGRRTVGDISLGFEVLAAASYGYRDCGSPARGMDTL